MSYRLYPSINTQNQTKEQKAEGWENLRDIAIDIMNDSLTNEKIKEFESKLAKLDFERKESVKLEDEQESIWQRLTNFYKERHKDFLLLRIIYWIIIFSILFSIGLYLVKLPVSNEIIAGIIGAATLIAITQKEF